MDVPGGNNAVLYIMTEHNAELEAKYMRRNFMCLGAFALGLGMFGAFTRFRYKIPTATYIVVEVSIKMFITGSSMLLANNCFHWIRAAERKAKYQYARECLIRAQHGIRLSSDDHDS